MGNVGLLNLLVSEPVHLLLSRPHSSPRVRLRFSGVYSEVTRAFASRVTPYLTRVILFRNFPVVARDKNWLKRTTVLSRPGRLNSDGDETFFCLDIKILPVVSHSTNTVSAVSDRSPACLNTVSGV